MMRKALIYGTGKTALVLQEYVQYGYEIAGFVVPAAYRVSEYFLDKPVLPLENIQETHSAAEHCFFVAVGYHRMNVVRAEIIEDLEQRGYILPPLIDSRAVIADGVRVGAASIVLDNVSVQPGARIGRGNFVWSNSVVAHGVTVEDYCWITSGAVIAGDSVVASNCFLGINCTVGHNLKLGEKTFVGAGSVVTKNTAPDSVLVAREAELGRLDSTRFLSLAQV